MKSKTFLFFPFPQENTQFSYKRSAKNLLIPILLEVVLIYGPSY